MHVYIICDYVCIHIQLLLCIIVHYHYVCIYCNVCLNPGLYVYIMCYVVCIILCVHTMYVCIIVCYIVMCVCSIICVYVATSLYVCISLFSVSGVL